MRPSPSVRVAARLAPAPSGCIEWTGLIDRKGYGKTWFEGRSQGAHRVAWQLANGPIPDGLMVMHSCDNPPCCNVAHLSLGTAADNQADKAAKGRARNQNARKTHCPKGHPYSEANTYTNPRGSRECLTCKRATRNAARDRRTSRRTSA
jgi:hypothetical protein